jgi:DNA-binding GntR family transcriptional regulator
VTDAGLPKFKRIAKELEDEIRSGRLDVGALLPTEAELVALHRVSRYTARMALEELERLGFIHRRRGTRSMVGTAEPNDRFIMALPALGSEVQQVPSRLHLLSCRRVRLTQSRARLLGVTERGAWVRAYGVRTAIGSGASLCSATIWLRPEFEELLDRDAPIERPLHIELQSRTGLRIEFIEVEVSAGTLNARERHALGIDRPEACLRVARHYFDGQRRRLMVKLDTQIADRLRYRLSFSRESTV